MIPATTEEEPHDDVSIASSSMHFARPHQISPNSPQTGSIGGGDNRYTPMAVHITPTSKNKANGGKGSGVSLPPFRLADDSKNHNYAYDDNIRTLSVLSGG
jgi:hypothetical protein